MFIIADYRCLFNVQDKSLGLFDFKCFQLIQNYILGHSPPHCPSFSLCYLNLKKNIKISKDIMYSKHPVRNIGIRKTWGLISSHKWATNGTVRQFHTYQTQIQFIWNIQQMEAMTFSCLELFTWFLPLSIWLCIDKPNPKSGRNLFVPKHILHGHHFHCDY